MRIIQHCVAQSSLEEEGGREEGGGKREEGGREGGGREGGEESHCTMKHSACSTTSSWDYTITDTNALHGVNVGHFFLPPSLPPSPGA